MATPERGASKIGERLAEALGLDSQMINSIELLVKANDVITVKVVFYPDEDQMEEVLPILQEYELVKKEEVVE